MAITTLTELTQAVEDWLRRPSVASKIPDFISLCEADMQRRLRVGEQEQASTVTTTQGNTSITLPTGLHRIRRVRLIESIGNTDLWPVALAPSDSQNWNREGKPLAYSIIGNTLSVRPTPNTTYTLQLNYYAKFAPLTDADPTNWILESNPDAYLYGTLLHSAPYLGTDVRLPLWEGGYENAIKGINREDFEKRFSELQRQTEVAHVTNRRYSNIYGGF